MFPVFPSPIRILALFFASCCLCSALQAEKYAEAEIDGRRATVIRVNVREERLRLFLNDEQGRPFKTFKRLDAWLRAKGQRLVFGMNAGMYHADYSAVGLHVEEGHQVASINTSSGDGNFFLLPNGIFVLTDKGAHVLETTEYPRLKEKVILASQSGPLLLRNGVIHPKFIADSDSRLFRNGVGVASSDEAIFAISEEPLNLHEFARLFRDVLKCKDALFFDGTVSSLHSTQLRRSDFKIDLGPLIGITQEIASGDRE